MAHERVLWVEDEADTELQYLYAPVVVAGFDLHVARDASQAVAELQKEKFDAVIVDVRIPPGYDQRWLDLYEQAGSNPAASKLGLHLLTALLVPERSAIQLREDEIPGWLRPEKCGVFSVEAGVAGGSDLEQLGVKTRGVKGPDLEAHTLLNLIKAILDQSK